MIHWIGCVSYTDLGVWHGVRVTVFQYGVPDGRDMVAAAAIPVAYGTSHVALIYRAKLKFGQVVGLGMNLSYFCYLIWISVIQDNYYEIDCTKSGINLSNKGCISVDYQ
ncbi:hypothetical protein L1987_46950 [Smallanthus sonchifolius]|uniref:Uncharacterized protein n=1 Tax=Smallanthus sonchifolius TaxID=185202 RepID=A0ACB9G265_9ASTR|nr:hypothetical protein L1987_46950 [Smallanthus sonchifolius]